MHRLLQMPLLEAHQEVVQTEILAVHQGPEARQVVAPTALPVVHHLPVRRQVHHLLAQSLHRQVEILAVVMELVRLTPPQKYQPADLLANVEH